MKKCTDCGVEKSLDDFYAGTAKCKPCYRSRVTHRRRTNPAVQAYDRERAKRPEKKAQIAASVKRWRNTFPEKASAESKVHRAIKNGTLVRKPCEQCGNPKSHAHHDDYSKPLDVRWLCAMHHRRWHADHPEMV